MSKSTKAINWLASDRAVKAAEARLTGMESELHAQQRLTRYTMRRVAQESAAGTVAPQFIEYIGGDSEDAVEQSIEQAMAKTAEIASEVAHQLAALPQAPEPEPEITDDELRAMTLDQYAAARHTLGTGQGNPNGITNRVGVRARAVGIMGENDTPWSRAAAVQQAQREGRYGTPGGTGWLIG